MNALFEKLITTLITKTGVAFGDAVRPPSTSPLERGSGGEVIPPKRVRYLSEISESNRAYDAWVAEQCTIATKLYQLQGVKSLEGLKDLSALVDVENKLAQGLHPECKKTG